MRYTIDSRESKRITCLRAICVIFVIYLHQYAGEVGNTGFVASGTIPSNEVLQGIQYIFSRIITFSAVPLFFLVSSVLLYAKEFSWKSNMKKKLKTLVLPYVLWITLYIIVYFIGQTLPITSVFFQNAGRMVSDMTVMDFIGAYTGIGGHGLFVNALWFLRDLIVLNVFAIVIKKLIDKFPIVCLVLICMLWNFGSIPSVFILNKQGIVFFALGYYVVKYGLRMKTIDKTSILGNVVLYITAIAAEFYFYKTDNLLITPAHSFSVVLGIMLLVRLTGIHIKTDEDEIAPVFMTIAKYSFFIYAAHDMIQTTFKKLCARLIIQNDAAQIVEYALIPICTIAIAIGIAVIIEKVLPRTFSIITGSRKMKETK